LTARRARRSPIADRLAVVIDRLRLLRERSPGLQTIRVYYGAGPRSGLADGADINAAPLADQELGGARAKAVELDEGPVCGADVDRPVGIAVVRVLWARQNEQPQARSRVSAGARERRRQRRRLPQ
jgi:hypothetical protein